MRGTFVPSVFSVAPSFGIVPQRTQLDAHNTQNGYFVDDDTAWAHFLAHPVIGAKDGSCIRGAVFAPNAMHPTQLNVEEIHGLVLDVDEFDQQPIALESAHEVIAQRLGRHRHIVWTTYNSTPLTPRYRVILPLARPVPRRRYRSLWNLVNRELGFVVGEGQWNADRLGYLPRLPNEAARWGYRWWVHQGPVLDPFVRFGELEETPDLVFLADHSSWAEHARVVDESQFVAKEDALQKARAYMRDAHLGVKKGSRHLKLFEKACQLWWDFWLDYESVVTVLLEVNSRLEEPKPHVDVMREVEAGFAWTRGPAARPQKDAAGHRRMRPPPVTHAGIEDWSKRVRRRPGQQELGNALNLLARREAYATSDHVLDVTRQLARAIGGQYPKSDATQIAKLFWHSLSIMRAQAPHQWPRQFGQTEQTALELVRNLVMQRQHEAKAEKEHEVDSQKRQLAERILEGTAGKRSTPYTQEEFHGFADQQRCTPAELRRRLVVQVGPSLYFFRGESGYSQSVEQGQPAYASTALAAFEGDAVGVQCYVAGETDVSERKLKTAEQLVDQYGVAGDGVVYSFVEQRSRYDAPRRVLIKAAASLRRITPERILEVERYFELIPDKEIVLDWLAWLPRLDRAARCLYLVGPKDCGKSFLPLCFSRLWNEVAPTKGDMLFLQTGNDAILKNPLVHCDERMPNELRGRRGTERFRDEIASLRRQLNPKNKKFVDLEGGVRWVISANHPHLIEVNETLSKNDVDALWDRIDVIDVPPPTVTYLRYLGYERTRKWFEDDLVAKHILWLAETRDLGACGRFGPAKRAPTVAARNYGPSVDGGASSALEVEGQMRYGGFTGQLVEWLYNDVMRCGSSHFRWGVNGTAELHALINVDDVLQQWEAVMGLSSRRPSRPQMIAALKALSKDRVRDMADRRRFHALSIDTLEEWARINEVDLEEIGQKVRDAVAKRLAHFYRETGPGLEA